MDEAAFEGTLVLEKLAEIDEVDAFFEAVDSDDLPEAKRLMLDAGIAQATIDMVFRKILSGDDS